MTARIPQVRGALEWLGEALAGQQLAKLVVFAHHRRVMDGLQVQRSS